MDRVAAAAPRGLAVLRREAPIHALMILVMAAAVVAATPGAMLGGALALLVVAIGCAAAARRVRGAAGHLTAQCLDLWAMALGMLALVHPGVDGLGLASPGSVHAEAHHGLVPAGWVAYLVVAAAWLGARLALARGGVSLAGVRAIPAALTAAGLAAMPLVM